MLKGLPIPFRYILAVGLFLGLVIGFKTFIPYMYWGEIEDYNWYRSALPHVINYFFWPFLVPFIHWTFERYRFGKGASLHDRVMTILMALSVPFMHEAVTNVIYFSFLHYMDAYEFTAEAWGLIKGVFLQVYIGRIVEFWIIYGLFGAFDYYRKYKDKQAELVRIEAQLNRTKLAVLKMQLQPHFLFNALNSISSLMEIDVKKAQVVTARLGDLLRGILDQDERIFVSLEEEMNYVKAYLDIEKVRFEDRLQITYDLPDELLGVQVPLLTIQPLVENAIKHGVANVSRAVKVNVSAHSKMGRLVVEVSDDGKGQEVKVTKLFKNGIGLSNLRDRLKELYKGEARLNILTKAGEGFMVQILLPINRNHANH